MPANEKKKTKFILICDKSNFNWMPKQILIDWWRWWQRRWQWYMRCTLDCCCCCCQHPCHLRSLGKHFTLAVEEWDEVSCMPETHQLPSMVLPYSVQREQHQHWSLQKCHPKSDSRHIDADTLHRVWQVFSFFPFLLTSDCFTLLLTRSGTNFSPSNSLNDSGSACRVAEHHLQLATDSD